MELTTCNILGTDILVTDMAKTVALIEENIEELRGKYICVGNVHTTVMAHDDAHYHKVQHDAAFVLPDGKPLSVYSKKQGYADAQRVTGPDLMLELFARDNGLQPLFLWEQRGDACTFAGEADGKVSESCDRRDGVTAVPPVERRGGCGCRAGDQ